MAKHTPGPWHVGRPIGACRDIPLYADSEHAFDFVEVRSGGNESQTDANAALIAAAPELLSALDLAKATIERLHRHAPGSANGTLDVVNAALGKARGQ